MATQKSPRAKLMKQLATELENDRPAESFGTKTLRPSASKTDHLLQCGYPWGRELPLWHQVNRSHETRFGSAFHEVIAAKLRKPTLGLTASLTHAAAKWSVDIEQLRERVTTGYEALTRWLKSNEYGIRFDLGEMRVEQSYAIQPMGRAHPSPARVICPPDEDHTYCDATPNEIPGTADLVIVTKHAYESVLLVLDHKTGELPSVETSGQISTLLLAAERALPATDTLSTRRIAAILHAPREGGPCTVYAVEKNEGKLNDHLDRLADAMRRIGDGSLRPGPQCHYCPALQICPTQSTTLVHLRRSAAEAITKDNAGAVHERLQQYRKAFQTLDRQITEEIKRAVRETDGGCNRPDGNVTRLEMRRRRELSMASIKRALGAVKGEKEIQRLTELGCVEERSTEYLLGD